MDSAISDFAGLRIHLRGRAGLEGRAISLVSSEDHGLLRDIQRLRFLAAAIEQPPTLLVTHLVGNGITALATDSIQKMAPTAKRKAEAAPTAGHGLGSTRW